MPPTKHPAISGPIWAVRAQLGRHRGRRGHTGAAPLAAKAVVGGLGAPSAATGSEDGATWGTPLEGLALP